MKQKNPRKRTSFLKKASILLAVTSALALTVCVTVAYRLFFADVFTESELLTVPRLTGTVLGERLPTELEGFQLVRIDRYSSEPIGTVLAQSPAAGSERKSVRGKRYPSLTLYVSKGRECEAVPSVVGIPSETGEATLLSCGFSVERISRYDDAPAGEIIAQSVSPGTRLPKGETVTLTVSRGSAAPKVHLPDLSGLSRVRAESLLNALGLRVGHISHRTSDGAEGHVLSQLPLAGTALPEGARVDLTLSKKPPETTEIPDQKPSDTTDPLGTETAESPMESGGDTEQAPPERAEQRKSGDSLDRILDRLFEQYLPDISHN